MRLRAGLASVRGTSKGRIYLAGERGVRTLVGGGPAVLALAASAAPPLLVPSIAGETTLLEAVGATRCGHSPPTFLACCAPCWHLRAAARLRRRSGRALCGGRQRRRGGGRRRRRPSRPRRRLDADGDGAVALWDVAFDAPVFAVAATTAPPGASAKVLVAVASGGEVHLVSGAAGERLLRIDAVAHPGVLYAVAFSPSGTALVASGSEVIDAFNVPAGTRRARLRLPRGTARECHLTYSDDHRARLRRRAHFRQRLDAAVTAVALPPPLGHRRCLDCATCPTAAEMTTTAATTLTRPPGRGRSSRVVPRLPPNVVSSEDRGSVRRLAFLRHLFGERPDPEADGRGPPSRPPPASSG